MANEIVNGQITDAVTGKHADSSEGIITGSAYDEHMTEVLSGRDWHGDPAAPCYKKENFKGETPEKLLTFREVCGCVVGDFPIQYRATNHPTHPAGPWKDWRSCDTNIIDMGEYDYRLKPTKKVVPWTFDAPLLGLHIKEKSGSGKGVITYQMKQYVYLSSGIKSYQALLEDYEQLDGGPCGQEVEGGDPLTHARV